MQVLSAKVCVATRHHITRGSVHPMSLQTCKTDLKQQHAMHFSEHLLLIHVARSNEACYTSTCMLLSQATQVHFAMRAILAKGSMATSLGATYCFSFSLSSASSS